MNRFSVLACLFMGSFAVVSVAQETPVRTRIVASGTSPVVRSQAQLLVARNQNEWENIWRLPFVDQDGEMNGGPGELPIVDFDKMMIVGVILKTHGDSCTGVESIQASITHNKLLVRYSEQKPKEHEACLASLSTAFKFVAIERVEAPIVLKREE